MKNRVKAKTVREAKQQDTYKVCNELRTQAKARKETRDVILSSAQVLMFFQIKVLSLTTTGKARPERDQEVSNKNMAAGTHRT